MSSTATDKSQAICKATSSAPTSRHLHNHHNHHQHLHHQHHNHHSHQRHRHRLNNNNNNNNHHHHHHQLHHHHNQQARPWRIRASEGALNTSNPIREIIETMNLAENPTKKVIPLSIGDPTIFGNLKPCKEILDALYKANTSSKFYGYQTAAGMESARDAVAEYHFKCTGSRVKRQDIILASGCSHAIDLSICVLAQHNQNILIPRPGFPLYKTLTSVYGVQFKQYDLLADKNWSVDLKHLESLVDENTAAIVINNPSNPCGSVFSRRHLLQILELAERHRLPIIADEIYDKFVFASELYEQAKQDTIASDMSSDGIHSEASRSGSESEAENRKPITKADMIEASKVATDTNGDDKQVANSYDEYDYGDYVVFENDQEPDSADLDEQTDDGGDDYVPFISLSSLTDTVPILTCGGISKTCLIPGLRLGWIIINDKQNIFDQSVRNGLNRLTQRLMGPNSLVQGALNDILTNVPESFYRQTMDFIFRNAKLCYDRLKLVKGFQPFMPKGSMYLMVRFDPEAFPTIKGDLEFTSRLMNEESVLVLPGKCFDLSNYFRICLTVPTSVMDEALIRIKEFCERHYVGTDNEIGASNGTPRVTSNGGGIAQELPNNKKVVKRDPVQVRQQQQQNGDILRVNVNTANGINGHQKGK